MSRRGGAGKVVRRVAGVALVIDIYVQRLEQLVGGTLVVGCGIGARCIHVGTFPQAELGEDTLVRRHHPVPLAVLAVGNARHVLRVEPRYPVDGLVGWHAVDTVVHHVQALVDELRHAEDLVVGRVAYCRDLRNRVIEPHRLAVYLTNGLICPHLDARHRRDEALIDRLIDIRPRLILLHLREIVVAGDDDLIVTGGIGVVIVLQVAVVVVERDDVRRRLRGGLEEVGTRVGEQYLLVADGLQLRHDAEEAGVHLRCRGDVFLSVELVVGLRVEVVAA